MQKPDGDVCIVTEGIFDALSIERVALMHNDISNDQALLLSTLNKQLILVPDRDSAGLVLCDKALESDYSVSLPKRNIDVKDVNDAVVKYGNYLPC
jgi:DNA primase